MDSSAFGIVDKSVCLTSIAYSSSSDKLGTGVTACLPSSALSEPCLAISPPISTRAVSVCETRSCEEPCDRNGEGNGEEVRSSGMGDGVSSLDAVVDAVCDESIDVSRACLDVVYTFVFEGGWGWGWEWE